MRVGEGWEVEEFVWLLVLDGLGVWCCSVA
jgi:hypothetical protein